MTGLLLGSCNATKYVPAGKFLLKKNDVKVEGEKLDKDDLTGIIRQQPNYKRLGVKWSLLAYNSIDSAKVADKRREKNLKLRDRNRARLEREDRINSKRIERAADKNREYYTHKTVSLKDTANPQLFFREWYKYKIGKSPVIFDSVLFQKSVEQLEVYLRNKGFYYGSARGVIDYVRDDKCVVRYRIETGPQYHIDSVYLICSNSEVAQHYRLLEKSKQDHPLLNKPFDVDLLDSYRSEISKFMRDSSYYGFSPSSIRFIVDTVRSTMSASVGVELGDRLITFREFKDSVLLVPYSKYTVSQVYFHLPDTVELKGNYEQLTDARGLGFYNQEFLHTFDTLYYTNKWTQREGQTKPDLTFSYNGELYVKPRVFEIYSFINSGDLYRERNMDATYSRLRRLDMFGEIKTKVIENREDSSIEVHTYLIRGKKQSFSLEPRATNSNGFLGVSANASFINKNLFGGAEHLKIGLSGGFESQPPVFEELEGVIVKTSERSFNTLEISPSIQLEVPGFFPFRSSKVARKRRPQTIVATVYNYQRRQEFKRGTFQLSYDWDFRISNTQKFQIGLPLFSVIRFINVEKSDVFSDKLNDLNDLFLIDAYSNQFVWQDWRLRYEYNIQEKADRKNNNQLYFNSTFDPSGNLLWLFRNFQDTTSQGKSAINGVAYSQFMRLDNELIFAQPFNKERSIHFRGMIGAGVPYGNSENALPYDYSFFAGGANDIRGWTARTMGPGAYPFYLDTNRTTTQLGNFKLGLSAEFRFAINSFFKGAFFADAGNIWSYKEDPLRQGGQITTDFYKQLMLSSGFGIRMDLEFFIIRVDLAFPLHNGALPDKARWFWEDKDNYYDFIQQELGYIPVSTPLPFLPRLHFGIGYPF